MGRFFQLVFFGFNALMVWWLFDYWARVGDSLGSGNDAERAGAAVGTAIGSGLILFIWAAGAVVTGLLALLTRDRPQRAQAGVSDKKCPMCAEMVKADAKLCRFCGHNFDLQARMAALGQTKERAKSTTSWNLGRVTGLVIFALIVCGIIYNATRSQEPHNKSHERLQQTSHGSEDIDPAQYGLSGVKYATVYCASRSDGRKPVWMITDKGTYALNGPAISWVQETNGIGAPLVGSDGEAWKLARDQFPIDVVRKLIKFGLTQCN